MSRQGGGNFTKTIIDVGAAGAPTAILATGPVVYFEIEESQETAAGAANVPQGLNYKLPNDAFAHKIPLIPGDVAGIGDRKARTGEHGGGSILGNGTSFIIGLGATAATTIAKIESLTATPTSVILTQYYS